MWTFTVFFIVLSATYWRVSSHPWLPQACRVGPFHITDCASGGTCECFRACERLYAFWGPAYCHNVSRPSTFTELLAGPRIEYMFERPLAPGGHNVYETNENRVGSVYHPQAHEMYSEPERCKFNGWWQNNQCSCFCDWEGPSCETRVIHNDDSLFDIPSNRTASRRPYVYVYSLPPGTNRHRPRVAMDRNTPYEFLRRLKMSPHLTSDASTADLFFIPVSAMGVISHGVPLLAIRYVQETFPYLNVSIRANVKNHFIIFPWDFGGSWITGYPEMQHVRAVSHWGLTTRSKMYVNDCPLCGASVRDTYDTVIPDTMEHNFKFQHSSKEPRTTFLFFSGSRSHPIRSYYFDSPMASETGVLFAERMTDLAREMDRSVFCLAPPGAGFTTRAVLAVIRGCIPVLVGDDILQPFEGHIEPNWPEFSIRIPEHEKDNTIKTLRKIPKKNIEKMQKHLETIKEKFIWDESSSTDAFYVTLASLQVPSPSPSRRPWS